MAAAQTLQKSVLVRKKKGKKDKMQGWCVCLFVSLLLIRRYSPNASVHQCNQELLLLFNCWKYTTVLLLYFCIFLQEKHHGRKVNVNTLWQPFVQGKSGYRVWKIPNQKIIKCRKITDVERKEGLLCFLSEDLSFDLKQIFFYEPISMHANPFKNNSMLFYCFNPASNI